MMGKNLKILISLIIFYISFAKITNAMEKKDNKNINENLNLKTDLTNLNDNEINEKTIKKDKIITDEDIKKILGSENFDYDINSLSNKNSYSGNYNNKNKYDYRYNRNFNHMKIKKIYKKQNYKTKCSFKMKDDNSIYILKKIKNI